MRSIKNRYHVTVIRSIEHERHELCFQLACLNGGKAHHTPKLTVKVVQEETDNNAVASKGPKQPEIVIPKIRPATASFDPLRSVGNARPQSAAASTSSRSSRRADELQRILGKVQDRQQRQSATPGEPEIWSKEKLNKLLHPFL